MKEIEAPREMQQRAHELRGQGKSLGLVPTMGYFHEGHLSLMRRARAENDVVVVSLFVNPIQFGVGEDFERYPRDLARDSRLAESVGVDIIWKPTREEMYPSGFSTYVEETQLGDGLCGASRPGHFRGVTTVVLKLFNVVQPHRAYFGMKDFQQLRVVERMTEDLNLDLQIVRCPTVRESDGLALSSRNVYLTSEERTAALALSQSLFEAEAQVAVGETDVAVLRERIADRIQREPLLKIDYVEIRDADSLQPVPRIERPTVIALAVKVGKTRLIDNIVVRRAT